jgi:hypothetical protein
VKVEGQHRSGTDETGDCVGDGGGAVVVGTGAAVGTAVGAKTGEAVGDVGDATGGNVPPHGSSTQGLFMAHGQLHN